MFIVLYLVLVAVNCRNSVQDVGMVDVSHFAEIDVQGADAADLLEPVCMAKVGGDTQRWERRFKTEDSLALWNAPHTFGVTPVGMETYANGRRIEKSLRLQSVDLLTDYNLYECDLARPKVKAADFHGKVARLKFREREHQPATLCTLVMTNNIDGTGVARYPMGA